MTDQWLPSVPLVPAGDWASTCGCTPEGGVVAIADNIVITGAPGAITSSQNDKSLWALVLNDGTPAADFRIDRFDSTGALADSPMTIVRATGVVSFNDPVMLAGDPTEPLEAATKDYVDARTAGGPFMPVFGGVFTGVVTFPSNNSVVINGALNTPHAILGQVAGLNRWQLQMPDQTTEGVGNVGANFSLSAFSTIGGFLGTWLTINRADGLATFNGSAVVVSGVLAVQGQLQLQGPANLIINGGNPGDALTTNGAGNLSWAARLADAPSDGQFYTRQNAAWAVSPGGMTDAPNDGTAYARKSVAWAHLTHTDITDWTATLAPYALTTTVPVASSTTPTMNGTAAVGTGTTWARADHVHPTDTSRYAASNPSGYQTAAQVTAALPVASSTTPLMDGVAAIGAGTTWARADHVHPTSAINDNRIINGDMRIDQRNNGAGGSAVNVYTVDRWLYLATQAAKGTWQRTTSNIPGFPYCLALNSLSAYTSLAADYFAFRQPFEADQISDLQWGTSNAQPITLSFWAACSLTGTFSGCVTNYAGTRSYPFTYTVSAANTPTRIVVTIPGDTGGTWVMSGNAGGALVYFDLGCGSTNRGPASAWASASYMGATGSVSVVGTNAATFYLTGVKLEIGSVATPYNRQSLAKSMADCQRYYTVTQFAMLGYATAGAYIGGPCYFPVAMRAVPTIVIGGAIGADANVGAAGTPDTISTLGFRMAFSATAAGVVSAARGVGASAEL